MHLCALYIRNGDGDGVIHRQNKAILGRHFVPKTSFHVLMLFCSYIYNSCIRNDLIHEESYKQTIVRNVTFLFALMSLYMKTNEMKLDLYGSIIVPALYT